MRAISSDNSHLADLMKMILIFSSFLPRILPQSTRMVPTRYEIVNIEGGHLVENVGGRLFVLEAGHELR